MKAEKRGERTPKNKREGAGMKTDRKRIKERRQVEKVRVNEWVTMKETKGRTSRR